MNFVLNRNYKLRSTRGHIVDFIKGEPVYVPPAVRAEAIAIGAESVDGPVDVLGPETTPPVIPQGTDREELILAAMAELAEKNKREDFTGNGLPHIKAIEKMVGFDIVQKERDEMWTKFKTGE